jgi:hypothetical protein
MCELSAYSKRKIRAISLPPLCDFMASSKVNQCRTKGGVEPNSQFRGIYIHDNLIRIRVSFICKLSRVPKGLLPPDPHSLCTVSATKFFKPLKKILV